MTGSHLIWSGEGARLFGQRWNPPGYPAIYTGTSFAVCLVELLVHANRKTPPSNARYVEATIPSDVSREIFDTQRHEGWDDPFDVSLAQAFGRDWLQESRSALLIVPSIVTAGRDTNVVVNPNHADAAKIVVGPETFVSLDPRLFGPILT